MTRQLQQGASAAFSDSFYFVRVGSASWQILRHEYLYYLDWMDHVIPSKPNV